MKSNYDYYAQHMHIHTSYEQGASMAAQAYRATNVGLKYTWLTDHDCLRGTRNKAVNIYDFEWNGMSAFDEAGREHGFQYSDFHKIGTAKITDEDAYSGTRCMKLSCQNPNSEWEGCAVEMFSSGKRHMASLLSDLLISLSYKINFSDAENSRFIIEFLLSEQPPECNYARLRFVAGPTDSLSNEPHTLILPLDANDVWQKHKFDMKKITTSKEAKEASIGGADNVFGTIILRLETRHGAYAEAFVDDFSKVRRNDHAATYEYQKEVAEEVGRAYGIKLFVAAEISAAGPHKNCFSTQTPVIPYENMSYKVTDEYACELMQRLGFTYSLNHPLVRYKGVDTSDMDLFDETEKVGRELLENLAHGATLLEIGFPYGRYMPYECHAHLWDMLALEGLILTGYGATDSHSAFEGWYDKNHPDFKNGVRRGEKMFKNTFVTWFGVDAGKEPSEDDFVKAMISGNGYSATPMLIKGGVNFATESGHPMGSIMLSKVKIPIRVNFSIENASAGWRFVWLEDGERVSETTLCDGKFEASREFIPKRDISFIRAEIYDEERILLLLTNPIYYVKDATLLKKDYSTRIVNISKPQRTDLEQKFWRVSEKCTEYTERGNENSIKNFN